MEAQYETFFAACSAAFLLVDRLGTSKNPYERSPNRIAADSPQRFGKESRQRTGKNAGWRILQKQNAGQFLLALRLLFQRQHQAD